MKGATAGSQYLGRCDMARSGSSFGRREAKFAQQKKVLVICEDTKSGKTYLEDAKVHYRASAVIEVVNVGHTDPRGIVKQALARQSKYDVIYYVMDRDTHPTFDEAVGLVQQSSKVKLIVSYPCFEYWIFLHFKYSRRGYNRSGGFSPGQNMIRALKACEGMDGYDKGTVEGLFDLLLPRLPFAKGNAARAEQEAKEVGQPNPSTRLHFLLEQFEILGTPQEVR